MVRTVLKIHVRLVAVAIPLLDRLLPLKHLLALMTPRLRIGAYAPVPVEEIDACIREAVANPRHMKRRACIRRGLLLLHFLRLSGREAVATISVGPDPSRPGKLLAHCWVSLEGRCVADPPAPDMKPILHYPAPPR